MSRKRLTPEQVKTRDLLQQGAVDYAAKRIAAGATYPEIEKELKAAGVTDHNGTPFHNANLSSGVIKRYPELRKRSPRKKPATSTQESWIASANALAKLLK